MAKSEGREVSRIIRAIHVEGIRRVFGRGPENIYVKAEGNVYIVHFSLVRCPLEAYILERFDDGLEFLRVLYQRVGHLMQGELLEKLQESTGREFKVVEMEIDAQAGKYRLGLEMH